MKIEHRFIGEIQKNLSELIKIHVYEWRGNDYLDLRVYYRPKGAEPGAELPTKKGFRINAELLDELINLLHKAQDKLGEGNGTE